MAILSRNRNILIISNYFIVQVFLKTKILQKPKWSASSVHSDYLAHYYYFEQLILLWRQFVSQQPWTLKVKHLTIFCKWTSFKTGSFTFKEFILQSTSNLLSSKTIKTMLLCHCLGVKTCHSLICVDIIWSTVTCLTNRGRGTQKFNHMWGWCEMTQIMVLIYTDITHRDFVSVCWASGRRNWITAYLTERKY